MKNFYNKYKHDIKIISVLVFAMIAVALADIYFPVIGG